MTTYKRINEPTFEKRVVGPEGYEPWGIPADGMRPEGTVIARSVGTMPTIAFVGPEEAFVAEFEPA